MKEEVKELFAWEYMEVSRKEVYDGHRSECACARINESIAEGFYQFFTSKHYKKRHEKRYQKLNEIFSGFDLLNGVYDGLREVFDNAASLKKDEFIKRICIVLRKNKRLKKIEADETREQEIENFIESVIKELMSDGYTSKYRSVVISAEIIACLNFNLSKLRKIITDVVKELRKPNEASRDIINNIVDEITFGHIYISHIHELQKDKRDWDGHVRCEEFVRYLIMCLNFDFYLKKHIAVTLLKGIVIKKSKSDTLKKLN